MVRTQGGGNAAARPSSAAATAPHSSDGRATFTIGQLAREFGITARALRFYEDRGLISPRRQGQNRIYSRRDRARLKLIVLGKRVGFTLSAIQEMLDLYDLKDGQVTQLRVAREKFAEQVHRLERQREDLDQALADLRRTRDLVSDMLREREREAG